MGDHPYELETQAIKALLELTTEAELLREEIMELESCMISSPYMNGMPRADYVDGDAMARRIVRQDALRRRLDSTEKQVADARRKAAAACTRIDDPKMRAFYEIYYVDGLDFSLAQTISGASDRECARYVRLIEG